MINSAMMLQITYTAGLFAPWVADKTIVFILNHFRSVQNCSRTYKLFIMIYGIGIKKL